MKTPVPHSILKFFPNNFTKIFKNTYFEGHLRTATSMNCFQSLLLNIQKSPFL